MMNLIRGAPRTCSNRINICSWITDWMAVSRPITIKSTFQRVEIESNTLKSLNSESSRGLLQVTSYNSLTSANLPCPSNSTAATWTTLRCTTSKSWWLPVASITISKRVWWTRLEWSLCRRWLSVAMVRTPASKCISLSMKHQMLQQTTQCTSYLIKANSQAVVKISLLTWSFSMAMQELVQVQSEATIWGTIPPVQDTCSTKAMPSLNR